MQEELMALPIVSIFGLEHSKERNGPNIVIVDTFNRMHQSPATIKIGK
jgi:hypothetical protein